jgi:hypothetical protein
MKKISTMAVKQSKNISGKKLTIGLDLGGSVELVLLAGRSGRSATGTEAGDDGESHA